MNFVCLKCGNKDLNYWRKRKGGWYCRKCLTFIGEKADKKYKVNKGFYNLNYPLTDDQIKASDFILRHVQQNKSCALNAVCGAGKTEIIYETIKYCLSNQMKIGITIPRKDVVIELKERLSKDFNVKVVGVYGGCSKLLESDIIVLTTHQAYRYIGYFDVLIIDEVDAFPFKGNDTLKNIVDGCSKVFVYLSATMPKYIENNKKIDKFYLNKRYHGFKMPVPKCKEAFFLLRALKRVLKKYKDKVVLVYFPTIKIQKRIAKRIKYDYIFNSKIKNRDNLLKKIKEMDKGIVLTTTVLERGITIKNVQVVVYNAEHELFDKDTLIQISGRVGRSIEFNKGEVVFICKRKNENIKRAIKTINKANE